MCMCHVYTEMKEWIVGYRRKLHAIPELMYDLSETSAIVRGALDEIGVPYKYPVAKQVQHK